MGYNAVEEPVTTVYGMKQGIQYPSPYPAGLLSQIKIKFTTILTTVKVGMEEPFSLPHAKVSATLSVEDKAFLSTYHPTIIEHTENNATQQVIYSKSNPRIREECPDSMSRYE